MSMLIVESQVQKGSFIRCVPCYGSDIITSNITINTGKKRVSEGFIATVFTYHPYFWWNDALENKTKCIPNDDHSRYFTWNWLFVGLLEL